MKTSSEYRAAARQNLGNNIFANKWLYAVVVMVIQAAAMAAVAASVLGVFLIGGFFMIGVTTVFLKLARGGEEVDLADIFAAKDQIGNSLLLGLLKNLFLLLWSLLFVIPGVIKFYSYSMVYYIQTEHPEYDWKQTINESRRMMDGHKFRLFSLDLSFLGWLILGALCFGIGTFFVLPYMQAARANFYLDLKAQPVVE